MIQEVPWTATLPICCSFDRENESLHQIMELGKYVCDTRTGKLIPIVRPYVAGYNLSHTSESGGTLNVLGNYARTVLWYSINMLLDPQIATYISKHITLAYADASTILNVHGGRTFMLLQKGVDAPIHTHLVTVSTDEVFTISYCFNLTDVQSNIGVKIENDWVPITSRACRMVFDAAHRQHETLGANCDPNIYLWIVFDDVTQLKHDLDPATTYVSFL